MDRKDQVVDYHAFVQDTWSVSKNLTLNLGLRFEYNSLVWPKQGAGVEETYGPWTVTRSVLEDTTAYSWSNLVPRIGAIYDIFSDGTTLFKVSYGRYLVPNQMGFVNIAHPNGWFGVLEWYTPDGKTVIDYAPWVIPGDSTKIGHPNYDLKPSYTDELTVNLERELWKIGPYHYVTSKNGTKI
jgi:outer membrane receptor protein involved in Fe transport